MRIRESTRKRARLTSLDSVDSQSVVRVNVGKSSRNCNSFIRGQSSVTWRVGNAKRRDLPNHFLDSLDEPSMTSRTPGLRDSIEGTWLARLERNNNKSFISIDDQKNRII